MIAIEFVAGDRVHVLQFGVSKCKTVPGLPYKWPAGHLWVRAEDFAAIPVAHRCPFCMRKSP